MKPRALLVLLLVVLLPMVGAVLLLPAGEPRTDHLLPALRESLAEETRAWEEHDWPRPPVFGEAVPGSSG